MRLNGKAVTVPNSLFRNLDYPRRAFSYDKLSNGIIEERPKAMCLLGGSSKGVVLSTRYLTYNNNFSIVSHSIKPVYSIAKNCLFTEYYSPSSEYGKMEASRLLGMMEAIMIYAKEVK
jgi:hypothetical protein